MRLFMRQLALPICFFTTTFFLILLCHFFYGTYYEEYQGLFHAFLSGSFSPGTAFKSWYYQGFIGLSYFYSFLYQIFPEIEWLSWISFLYINISAAIIFYILYNRSKIEAVNWGGLSSGFMLFYILFADHIIKLQNARVAYLMCGSSLLALIFLFDDFLKIKNHFLIYISLLLFFLLGALTRSEPALGIATLLFCFSLVWHKNVLKVIFTALLPLIITISVIVGILIDTKLSDQFHKQVEPDIEMQLTVRKNIVPISEMKTTFDSIRYEAAVNMMWADPDIVSVDFLRSLIKLPPYTSINSEQLSRTIEELDSYYFQYKHLIILNLILIIFITLNLALKHDYPRAFYAVLYFIGFFIAIIFQTYMVKMRDWSFSPYLSIFTASIVFLYIEFFSSHKHKYTVLLLLLGGVSIWHFNYLETEESKIRRNQIYNQELYKKAHKISRGETLLINPTSYQNFISANLPFHVFNYQEFDRLYFFESQIASILPGYRQYLEKQCNCSVWNFSNFYRYLLSADYPKSVYAISTEQRMDLIARYLHEIHNYDIIYKEVNEFRSSNLFDKDRKFLRMYLLYHKHNSMQ